MDTESVADDEVERVCVSLRHSHVPMLDECDVVEFDEGAETIGPGTDAEPVLSIIEHAAGRHDGAREAPARNGRHGRRP